ncbi:MAG TPA: hypothetical protein VHE61_24365 [Opitutaceae bacterium]|nr:hypothetical protein [Opitutaceae bacterium]
MKTSGTHAFVNQLLVGLLVTIGFGGTIGLGTVWMRYQISVVADANQALQQQINDTERQIADTKTMVEEELDPQVLRQQNVAMHLGLTDLQQTQIVAVNEDPVYRLVARANQRMYEAREGGPRSSGVHFQMDTPVPAQGGAATTQTTAAATRAPNPGSTSTRSISLQFASSP